MCINYVVNNVNLDEVDKRLNDYVSTHIRKFDFYIIYCDCVIKFYTNFTTNIKTDCVENTNVTNLYEYLLPENGSLSTKGNLSNINQMVIITISVRCNMTHEHYINQPMSMCERTMNMDIARNPQLINSLDRNKDHSIIRKYLHIPFNN